MDKKIKICYFCEQWESGGIEAFLHNIINNFRRDNFEIDIISAKVGNSIFTEDIQKKGINIFELSGDTRAILKNHALFRKKLQEKSYDIVHLNIYQAFSMIYAKIAKKNGVKRVIVHSHNTQLRKSTTKCLKELIHKISKQVYVRYADILMACSQQAAKFMFPKKYIKKYEFIPNGINIQKFRYSYSTRQVVRDRLGVDDNFVVGCVGRISYQKNQVFLINVFLELLKVQKNAILLFVGEGDMQDELVQKCQSLGIADKVIFYGVSNEVEQLMCAMDVLAVPSLFEGLGIVVVEAQCLGLSVVCSENIPPEAILCENVKRISLFDRTDKWVEALLTVPQTGSTIDNCVLLQAAGFDEFSVAAKMEEIYTRG